MDTGYQVSPRRPLKLYSLRLLFLMFFLFPLALKAASSPVLNVYTWAEEIPPDIITEFEKETGITVNNPTFGSNEVMYSKLRTNPKGYDLVEPSSYYIQRMARLGMLEPLDSARLTHFADLDPWFARQGYDPGNRYSVPFLWGTTGIFANKKYVSPTEITHWSDLQHERFHNQIMLLDDSREAFGMALRMLGYSINDTDPSHLHEAWLKLKDLMPNIRLFNSDAVKSILIDEDAPVGMVWSGDFSKAHAENPQLAFILPEDGFEVWVDNFAILKNAPHRENAYRFLDFLMRPDISSRISQRTGYATASLAARKQLPSLLRNNRSLYPSESCLRHAEVQTDVGDNTFSLYEQYWEKLKTGV